MLEIHHGKDRISTTFNSLKKIQVNMQKPIEHMELQFDEHNQSKFLQLSSSDIESGEVFCLKYHL